MPIRVLIVDDHGILRAGLHALLRGEQDIDVVDEAGSAEEALVKIETLHPNVVLMDISMGGMSGVEATRQIRARFPDVQVLILTVHEDKALLQESLQAGAAGYILKRAAKSELINAVQAVYKGDVYVHPSMTRALLNDVRGLQPAGAREEQPEPLTKREVEILRLIVQGYTSGQIAEKLNISIRTVEFHRANIMDKLNLKSRVGLVRYAAENGLL